MIVYPSLLSDFRRLGISVGISGLGLTFDDMYGQRRGHFLKYFWCSNDLITQKVYFSRLLRVYVGFIIFAAYFCRLAGRQARVRFSARHHREVCPTELTSDEEMERGLGECTVSYECDWMIVCML
jgi:hypothetical protein